MTNIGRKFRTKNLRLKTILAVSTLGIGAVAAPAIAQLNCVTPEECKILANAYSQQGRDIARANRLTAVAILTETGPSPTPIRVTVQVDATVIVQVPVTVVVERTVVVQVIAATPLPVPTVVQSDTATPSPSVGDRIMDAVLPTPSPRRAVVGEYTTAQRVLAWVITIGVIAGLVMGIRALMRRMNEVNAPRWW